MSIFESYQQRFEQHLQEEYSLQDYLALCKENPLVYATAAERMLAAIGDPETYLVSVMAARQLREGGLAELAMKS